MIIKQNINTKLEGQNTCEKVCAEVKKKRNLQRNQTLLSK